jgi:homogentisate 1,2-dioxygenase
LLLTLKDGYKTDIPHKADIENCFLTLNPRVATLAEQGEWAPFPLPKEDEKIDFVDGLHTIGGSGDPNLREGIALYVFMINADMDHRAFCNTDGDFLVVAQLGNLDIQTELGKLFLQPGEICVIPRGIRFSVRLGPGHSVARGYITEIWGSRWELPDLGPLGGHGLANPRDFLHPVAYIDDNLHEDWTVVNKANGVYNALEQDHSPYDLVAWHGNVVPYKVLPPLSTLNLAVSKLTVCCSTTSQNSPRKTQPQLTTQTHPQTAC